MSQLFLCDCMKNKKKLKIKVLFIIINKLIVYIIRKHYKIIWKL